MLMGQGDHQKVIKFRMQKTDFIQLAVKSKTCTIQNKLIFHGIKNSLQLSSNTVQSLT